MEDKKKSIEQFIEVEKRKTPEQLEKEILADPAYPRITPTPKTYDKLMARIAVYEAEKAKAEKEREKAREEEKALDRLSDEDKEALRLGRELLARQQGAKERDGKTEEAPESRNADDQSGSLKAARSKRTKKKKKAYLLVAAAAVCACGLGITAMGGPDTVIRTMTGTFGGREQSRVDTDRMENTLVSGESEEETAYQAIKDKLGFDAVRPVYLPNGVRFQEMQLDEKIQNVLIIYASQESNLYYTIQAHYSENKYGVDVEDSKIDSYVIKVDGMNISIKEYEIVESGDTEFVAEFQWRDMNYSLSGIMDKEQFEEIVKNLHFV